ncbi:MAG: hypothetical protein IJR07_07140 [Bacteroidaceae bacterium]|nr:hypothetical protein [Bacteroidaceae bacterium]
MKKIFVTVMVLMGVLGTMNMNAANNDEVIYHANVKSLGKYLELAIEQQQVVERLNDDFIKAQIASASDQELNAVVNENIKQMRKTLDLKQMRKYITLLNVTANNKKLNGTDAEDTTNYFVMND